MKTKNRIRLCLVLALFTVLLMPLSAFAAELPEFDKDSKCTLSVLLRTKEEEPVAGAEVTLYRVADVEAKDGKYVYPCVEEFAGFAEELEDIESQTQANSLFDYAVDKGIKGTALKTDSSGKAIFSEIDTGIYLVGRISTGEDGTLTSRPFLVVLPYADADKWVFNVIAMPKIGFEGDEGRLYITVKKIWNDNGSNRPESVKIRLLKDGSEYETVTLDESCGWSYKWENIDGRNNWSVQEVDVPEGYTVTYRNDGLDFTVYNSKELPYTGQLKWPVPLLACGGLVLMIIGLWVFFSGEKKKDE